MTHHCRKCRQAPDEKPDTYPECGHGHKVAGGEPGETEIPTGVERVAELIDEAITRIVDFAETGNRAILREAAGVIGQAQEAIRTILETEGEEPGYEETTEESGACYGEDGEFEAGDLDPAGDTE